MNIVQVNVLMVGLDNAGKTKLLYTLKGLPTHELRRTLGYNVETIEHNTTRYTIYDMGGHKTVRDFRNDFIEDKTAVIYVVDAADCERFEEAQKDLHELMENSNLSNVPLLVVANKMDLVPEFDVESLAEHLNLSGLKQKWNIYGVSAMEVDDRLFKISDVLNSMITEGDDKKSSPLN